MSQSAPTAGQLVVVLTGEGPSVHAGDAPVAHADDLGLTRGDGCFDATLVVTGSDGVSRVLHLDRHVDRLGRSAEALDIAGPDAGAWRAAVAAGLDAWPHEGQAMLKLVLTRGREEHPGGPLAYLTITPLSEETLARRGGLDVCSLPFGRPVDAFADAPWLLGGVKTIAYAVNMAAQREARARGAHDVLFVATDGHVLEGPTSALVVDVGGRLVTTPTGATGILDSITAATLFEAAADAGIGTDRRLLTLDDVHAADGAWLVSSVRGVAPVRRLDGRELAHDPGRSRRVAGLAGF